MADYAAPKGMRDFLPEEAAKREWAIGAIKRVYRRFGFVPMDTPALETVEVLERKCGEEIKGQLFRVDDGRTALRFDLTVPLSRVASSNTFKKPFKRYCIAPVWRREEPQKGRFREFYQADADIIGCPTVRAEAELIACACTAISELGFSGAAVLLNDRRIITAIAASLLSGKESAVLRILDKREKIGDAAMVEMLVSAGAKETGAKKLLSDLTAAKTNSEALAVAEKYSKEGAESLRETLSLVKEYGKFDVKVDLSLVRGLDYYTGAIFEISLGKGMGSVAGGGRYDNLLSMYGTGDSAVGISLGFERLMALMKERAPVKRGVFVAAVKDEFYPYALQVAAKLRADGIECQTDLNARSLKKQMDYAATCCRYIAVMGEREKKEGKVTLRDLESGKEELLTVEEAVKKAGS
ncbi:MAG: histidine--tRNA ligase [Candidatus Micrarchaeota archaeon]|nr:histidine--tRNA ligase [Candidatus Micrarchaeota archaeon]